MRRVAAIAIGIAIAGTGTAVLAARNSSGTYSLPSGNPVTGGKITTTWANTTLSDLGTELTDSLSRTGKGAMLAPLRTPNGSSSAPAWSFSNETGTGVYRAGAGDLRIATGGVDRVTIAPSGVVVGALSASALSTVDLTFSGALSGPVRRTNLPAVGQQISSSSGSFSTDSTSPVDVSNLSVSITTTGRPVILGLVADGTANIAACTAQNQATAKIYLVRASSTIATVACTAWSNTNGPTVTGSPPGVLMVDPVGAGTYTYKVQLERAGGFTGGVTLINVKLYAYEL